MNRLVVTLPIFLAMVLIPAANPLPAAEDPPDDQESKIQPIGGLAFKDELDVTVVNVIAHVTDKDGKSVTNLTQDDFRIYQDGEERPISHFQLYTKEIYVHHADTPDRPGLVVPTPVPVEDAEPEIDLRPIHMVIYIDNENLHPLDRNRVLNRVREFVRENLRPPVRMMVVSYQRSFKILQPFTSDTREVLDALKSVRTHTGGWPVREDTRAEVYDMMERYSGDQEQKQQGFYQVLGRIRSYADEEYNNLAFTMDALRGVVNTISGLPGKKSIVYVANGLAMIPGMDLFQAFANKYSEPSIMTQVTQYDRSSLFRSLVATANAQNITFYTIGAGGLEVTTGASADRRTPTDPLASTLGHQNYLDSLRYMANATGGFPIVDTNDFTAGLEKIEQDMFTYYSLGYGLNMTGSDRVHKVKVELPNHSDYKVRYRRRFVEKSFETRIQDKVFTALLFDIEEDPLALDLEAARAAPAAGDRWTVPLHISFPLANVALLPEGEEYVGRMVLFIAARDDRGKQSDMVRQEHQIRIPAADYEGAKLKRFGIDSSLLMEGGGHRVAVAVMDQVTRQTSFETIRTHVGGR